MRSKMALIPSISIVLAAAGCSDSSSFESVGEARQAVEPGTGAPDLTFSAPNEPSIAVNPTNPNNIVFAVGPTLWISNDGGASFPIVMNATIPSTHSGDRDSALAFDSQGRLFITYLLFVNTGGNDIFVQQINPATGLPAGPTANVTAQVGFGAGGNDKPWIAVDRSPTSPHRDRVYVVWVDGADVIRTAHADSPGTTWTDPVGLSSPADCPDLASVPGGDCFGWPPHIAVGADGGVYVSYKTGIRVFGANGGTSVNYFNFVADEHMVLRRSDDGGVSYPFTTTPAAQSLTTNTGGIRPLDRSFSWTLGSGQDWILPDRAHPQRLAIVFNADPTPSPNDGPGFDDTDVFIIRSADRGATWTAPQRVNADGAGPLQIFPTGAWDSPNDCLTVAWLDGRRGFSDPAFRNTLGNVLLDVILRTSADGGVTFGPEFQVNDVPANPDPGEGNFNAAGLRPVNRIGEYIGVLSRRGAIWPQNTGVLAFDDTEHRCAIPSACLLATRSLNVSDRTNVTAPVMAGTTFQLGSVANVTGDGEVGGNALIRDRGVFNGNLTLGGTLSHQNIFTVTGTLTQNDSPIIFGLQTKTFPVGAGTQTVAGAVTLTPGNFGNVTFQAGSQVTLVAGTYNFASLNIEPGARVLVTGGGVNVNVQGTFQLGDRSQVIGSGGSLFLYTNGTQVRIGTDARFDGLLVAPNATVNVFSRTVFNGCLGGRDVSLDTDIRLTAGSLRLPTASP